MSQIREFLNRWASQENHVDVQDGNTPKSGFNAADTTGEDNTSKPATAKIDAASDGETDGQTKDDGHQKVHKPSQGDTPSGDVDDLENTDTDVNGRVVSSENEGTDVDKGGKNDGGDLKDPDQDDLEGKGTTVTDEGGDASTPEEDNTADNSNLSADDDTNIASGAEKDDGKSKTQDSQENHEDEPDTNHDDVDTSQVDDLTVEPLPDTTEADETQQDIENFVEVSDALESFYQLVASTRSDGGMDARMARAVALGLERIDPYIKNLSLVPSQECFGETLSCETATEQTMDAIDATKQGIQQVVQTALLERIDACGKSVADNLAALATVGKKAEQLESRLKAVSTTEATKEMPNEKLHIDGVFQGNSVQALKDLNAASFYAFKTFPTQAADMLGKLGGELRSVNRHIDDSSTYENVSAEIGTALTRATAAFGKLPGAHQVSEDKTCSTIYLNNAYFCVCTDAIPSFEVGGNGDVDDGSTRAPTRQDALSLLREIQAVVKQATEAEKAVSTIASARQGLARAVASDKEAVTAMHARTGMSGGLVNTVSGLINRPVQFMSYLTHTLYVSTAHLEKVAIVYEQADQDDAA